MPHCKGKYGYWILRPLLLLVYVSFFMVQLFCITGPDSRAMISPSVSLLSFYKADEKKDTGDSKLGAIQKTKLNINKRFQRSIGDIIVSVAHEVQPAYSMTLYMAIPKKYSFLSLIISESLRGPPLVAAQMA